MTSRIFVSHDGPDSSGVRAEVHVQTGTGLIKEVVLSDKGHSANVVLKVPELKFPHKGWIRVDDPVYADIQDAYEAKREVAFRIESQRKKEVDRKLPIEGLRKNAEIARENTTSILAGIDGKLTGEAVTNPAEDPDSGDRHRAPGLDGSSAPAPVASSNSRVGATEETPWVQFNTDGRVNLGSSAVAGISGAETVARKHLLQHSVVAVDDFGQNDTENLIHDLTRHLLNVADKVQVAPLVEAGVKALVNRNSNSHTRARGIVYDTLEYIPFDLENTQEWVKKVEALSISRFLFIVSIAETGNPTATQESGNTETVAANSSNDSTTSSLLVYRPETSELEGDRASKETVEAFIALFNDSEIEKPSDLTPLIEWTFGVKLVKEVSDEALGAFVDFYRETDEENFVAVVNAAKAGNLA